MKSFKLLACLVTLQLTSGLTLQAADQQDFRQWTDANGRTMKARIVETPDALSVKIERQDGRLFTVPLKTFSADDQAYVKVYREQQSAAALPATAAAGHEGASINADLSETNATTWALLNAGGSRSAATYANTYLQDVIDGLNQQFAAKAVKTSTGLPMKVRTEPSDLGARVQISGDMPDMTVAAFVKQVARINGLAVKTDAAGMVVLVDKTVAPVPMTGGSLFGVAMNPQ